VSFYYLLSIHAVFEPKTAPEVIDWRRACRAGSPTPPPFEVGEAAMMADDAMASWARCENWAQLQEVPRGERWEHRRQRTSGYRLPRLVEGLDEVATADLHAGRPPLIESAVVEAIAPMRLVAQGPLVWFLYRRR
jgi:hypothetical protein